MMPHTNTNSIFYLSDLSTNREALRVASSLKQLDDDGLMGLQFQCVQRRGAQAVHSCAGHKHSSLGQARGPGGIQAVDVGASVEQNKEVDTTPGAQEGQDSGRWRRDKGGVGGVD